MRLKLFVWAGVKRVKDAGYIMVMASDIASARRMALQAYKCTLIKRYSCTWDIEEDDPRWDAANAEDAGSHIPAEWFHGRSLIASKAGVVIKEPAALCIWTGDPIPGSVADSE